MNNAILVRHSSYIVPNYDLGDCEPLEKYLSIWNSVYFRLEPVGYFYDEDKRELRLPRGISETTVQGFLKRPFQIVREADPAQKISIKLKVEPRNDIQRKSISFLIGQGKYEYSKGYSQLTLNLDTGDGKTYCAIAGCSFLGMKTIVVTHNDSIKQQWHDSFVKMTNLDARSICNISGSAAVKKLLKAPKIPYKIFLVNHRTISSYARKNGWEDITTLFKKLEIGVKIYDEAHLEFNNLLRLDMHTNTQRTIYLTATFDRSQRDERKIFDICFRGIAKYGRQTRAEKSRHIVYMPVMFNSHATYEDRAAVKGIKGLDKNKYLDNQMSRPYFYDCIEWLLKSFVQQEGKILVMLSKIDSITSMVTYIKRKFPDKTVGAYHSKIDQDAKIKALDSDIIISTPKSLGTGNDIPGLRFVIMTEPYSSAVTAEQTSGRLRLYKDKDDNELKSIYVELIDDAFPQVVRMYKKRILIFKKKCEHIVGARYND